MNMSAYIAYWKRGWWAWLMMLIVNVSFAAAAIPLAMVFADNLVVYYSSAACIWLVFDSPYLGWLFERSAQNSERIQVPHPEDKSSS